MYTVIRPIHGVTFADTRTSEMRVNSIISIVSSEGLDELKLKHNLVGMEIEGFDHFKKDRVETYAIFKLPSKSHKNAKVESIKHAKYLDILIRIIMKNPHERLSPGLFEVRNPVDVECLVIESNQKEGEGRMRSFSSVGNGSLVGGTFSLRDDSVFTDKRQLRNFCEMLARAKHSKYEKKLILAAEWIGKAINEVDYKNMIIYSFFAIETMIVTRDSGSVTSQVAENTAFLIFDTIADRKSAIKGMKNFYKVRSKIVHGRNVENIEKVAEKVVEISGDIFKNLVIREDLGHINSTEKLDEFFNNIRLSGTKTIAL